MVSTKATVCPHCHAPQNEEQRGGEQFQTGPKSPDGPQSAASQPQTADFKPHAEYIEPRLADSKNLTGLKLLIPAVVVVAVVVLLAAAGGFYYYKSIKAHPYASLEETLRGATADDAEVPSMDGLVSTASDGVDAIASAPSESGSAAYPSSFTLEGEMAGFPMSVEGEFDGGTSFHGTYHNLTYGTKMSVRGTLDSRRLSFSGSVQGESFSFELSSVASGSYSGECSSSSGKTLSVWLDVK